MIYITSTSKKICLCLHYPCLQSPLISSMVQWFISISCFSQADIKHPSVRVMALGGKAPMQMCKMFKMGAFYEYPGVSASDFLSCVMKTPSPPRGLEFSCSHWFPPVLKSEPRQTSLFYTHSNLPGYLQV